MKAVFLLMIGAAIVSTEWAEARPLAAIRELGTIGLCAHPNSLPFASKAGDPPGFQV
jgi:polar amino acid transport system substrate-binding protein